MYRFKKVVVGISGGVDSAVCALLLKRKGYDVEGVFMQNWDIVDEQGQCSANEEYKDAQYICNHLNIVLRHVNFVKPYWISVFSELIQDYESGFTPNPDILCNRHIKFDKFYHYARQHLNCDAIATGHYARTSFGPYLENYKPNTDVKLFRAVSLAKDQTFFLSQIQQNALRKTMFPLGDYHKSDIKQLAIEAGLEKIAVKKESVGICFIGDRNFQTFISEYVEKKPGPFVNIDNGKTVGRHHGIHQWTLGQRSRIQGASKPYYITKKIVHKNTILVAQGADHPCLHSSTIFTEKPHWIHSKPLELTRDEVLQCQFKFQHTERVIDCKVCEIDRGLVVQLATPKRALTAGQYAVFYKNDECLGSAKIYAPGPSYLHLQLLHKYAKEGLQSDDEDANKSIVAMLENPIVVNFCNETEIQDEAIKQDIAIYDRLFNLRLRQNPIVFRMKCGKDRKNISLHLIAPLSTDQVYAEQLFTALLPTLCVHMSSQHKV